MNVYRFNFDASCPVNGDRIHYATELHLPRPVPVEQLLAYTAGIGSGLHEDIADGMAQKFGGQQRITANHGGVEIETFRGQP